MTYSQRLTQASASDIAYLEYQIGAVEEELKQADGDRISYESELTQLRSSLMDHANSFRDAAKEQNLVHQLAEVQTRMVTIRTRLVQLQDELEKLAD
ncbi:MULTISPECIES: hypothetical protein [Paenibacillus]|uniref:Uncharacterized protein n=1 Tax=Paenibacillus xylanilyticus TaxID=248903 RepID=A0A7Y6EWH8_9BACL|nr:hypothetical protein [Paenibacillus xylanilyticus]NUU76793.1 hypothetical protein [Paenibacillus xylanilyticus]